MRWAGQVASKGAMRNAYKIFDRKPEGKRLLRKLRRRWEDNIKMNLREMAWEGVDWIGLARNKELRRTLVYTVMNLRVPQNGGKFLH
jgi:hypothetical protein